ncbi:MAG: DUF4252 domain-containing protein [Bacteroidaceae bacterium]|nr:DUF4252 domain-containing protein [Bacteroidaceae bacterium]
MKKFLSFLLLATLTVTVSAQSGRDIYNKYSDEEGVTAVYISKSMFKLIGKLPSVELNDEDFNLSELVKSLEGFYLIEVADNAGIRQSLRDDVDKYMKSADYEMLMEAKDDGETVRMFITSKGDEVKGFVMLIVDADECVFLCLDGSMSREALDKVCLSFGQSELATD